MKKPPPENNDRKNLQHEGARSDPAPKVRQPGKPKMDGAALKEVTSHEFSGPCGDSSAFQKVKFVAFRQSFIRSSR